MSASATHHRPTAGTTSQTSTPNPGVWVNLYTPSTLRWQTGPATVALTQTTDYPLADRIHFQINTDYPVRFPLRFRIPHWCADPTLTLNDHPVRLTLLDPARDLWSNAAQTSSSSAARWALVDRTWHNNDTLRLILPATLRLEPFPADGGPRSALAALCYGPLVLAAEGDAPLSTRDLPQISRTGPAEWVLTGRNVTFRPMFGVGDLPYTTYLQFT